MNAQAQAAIQNWQQTVEAAWNQQQVGLGMVAAQTDDGPRALTPQEIEVARSVFGDQIDYSQVRVDEGGIWATEDKASAMPGLITFPEGAFARPDYNAWLIHELTHILQYEDGRIPIQLLPDAILGNYEYGREQGLRDAHAQGKHFSEFGYEQQAEILRDYYIAREAGLDTSAYQPYVDQVRVGGSRSRILAPGPDPAPGPVV